MRNASGARLRSLSQLRLVPLLTRLLGSPWPARVQRLGAQALQRVSDRFPAIASLIERGERGLRSSLSAARRRRGSRGQSGAVRSPEAGHLLDALPSEVLRSAVASPSWQDRADAIGQWGAIPCSDSIPLLIEALRDPSAEVAASAAEALGQQGGSEAAAALRTIIANTEGYFSPIVRAAGVQGLARCIRSGELTGRHDLSSLRDAVTDVDAEVSLAAIAALTDLSPQQAVSDLLRLLRDASGYFLPTVRLAAANALVKTGACTEGDIAGLLASESDAHVQSVLAQATPAN